MLKYFVSALGDTALALNEVIRIADGYCAVLMAVDGIDVDAITAGDVQLPNKNVDEQREYLFWIEAEDQDAAENATKVILDTALSGRDKPMYKDIAEFLNAYSQAPWRNRIQALLIYDEEIDLLIFAPGQLDSEPMKIY